MSENLSNSDIVAQFQAYHILTLISSSMAALVAYEYCITFKQEVAMIWRQRWSIATWIFIANRYVMIGNVIWTVSPFTAQSCAPGIILDDILFALQYVIFAVFSSLRVYAIQNRTVFVALSVLILSLMPVAINIYEFIRSTNAFEVDPIFGTLCGAIENFSSGVRFNSTLAARLAVIAADILVLALTWRLTFRHWREGVRAGMRTPLSTMLLRDGTVYFVTLLIMNLAQVLVNAVPSLQSSSPIPEINQVLQPILISRFLLNLRQVGGQTSRAEDSGTQQGSTGADTVTGLHFSVASLRATSNVTLSSIIGNMGEYLDHEEETWDANEVVQAEDGAQPDEDDQTHHHQEN